MRARTVPTTRRPILFGEVLFDCFAGDDCRLGGAPFNVAWHLQGFGLRPLFVSRIGSDALGRQVEETMAAWGMDCSGLQRDTDHPTGSVRITLQEGQPTFDILADRAYDHIIFDPEVAERARETGGLLYHGTLAARAKTSAETLYQMRRAAGLPVFVDVNLRDPWWSRGSVEQALEGARWAKLNDDELQRLTTEPDPEQAARMLREQYRLSALIVTRGGEGVLYLDDAGRQREAAAPVRQMADTVGAGDAFAAVTILGILHDWPRPVTITRASRFAAAVCEIRGATSRDPDLYRQHLEAWSTP